MDNKPKPVPTEQDAKFHTTVINSYSPPLQSESNPNLELDRLLDTFRRGRQTVISRNKTYGNSHWKHGALMAALFPQGLILNNRQDFTRLTALNNILTKLVRYCQNWSTGGHTDSIHDLGVYAFILETIDQTIDEENKSQEGEIL